jgi:Tfp pilus assembly protein PilX
MIRRLVERFIREQDGITLVIALATMTVLAIATTGVIVAGTANEGTAWVSTQGRSAFAVAQQALAYGEGMVYGDEATGTDPPTDTQQLPTQPNGATGTYTVNTDDGITWTVVATGTLGGVTRTVSDDVTPAQTVTTYQLSIWNYLYEDQNNPSSVSGGAIINLPILTGGDFGASGSTTKILNNLEVGHNLTTSGNAQIGSPTSPIAKLEVVGTCAVNGPAKPAGTSPCDGSHNLTYASSVGTTLDTFTGMPTVNFQAAYNTQAGLTQTGCPAKLFDNNTNMDNGNSANISSTSTGLFGASYDCYVGTNHLQWNSATKTLTANGTFYFDGTLTSPSSNTKIVYQGEASFYFTGGVTWSNGSLCGIAGCGAGWDTSTNVLFVVADCTAQPSTGCVSISSANTTDQFGVYADGTYQVSGNSGNMAPVICDQFFISGGTDTLVPIKNFPPGTPAPSTSVSYLGTPPTGWSG